jgi:PiT family inorganic phosphate transporter
MISLGMLLGGKKIIGMLSKHSDSKPVCGISADVTSAFALLLLSAFNIPTSTTAAKTTAVMGAGSGIKAAFKNASGMLAVWLLTLPACAVIAYILTKMLL